MFQIEEFAEVTISELAVLSESAFQAGNGGNASLSAKADPLASRAQFHSQQIHNTSLAVR